MRAWFMTPRFPIVFGALWALFGVVDLSRGNVGFGIGFVILGLLCSGSGVVREVEDRRGERYGGPLGALAALTRPVGH